MEIHIKAIHYQQEIYCKQCDFKTGYKSTLKSHIDRIHTKSRTQCKECSWTGNPSYLQRHRSIHGSKRYKCDICCKEYPRKSHVEDHKNRAHFGVKYSCPKCEYKATTTANLKTHIKSKHEGVKSPCNQCDYKAFDMQSLSKHVKAVHLGLKPHQCTTCDFKTAIKLHLKNHESGFHGKNSCNK